MLIRAILCVNHNAYQGHPVCQPCRNRPEVRHCPTCRFLIWSYYDAAQWSHISCANLSFHHMFAANMQYANMPAYHDADHRQRIVGRATLVEKIAAQVSSHSSFYVFPYLLILFFFLILLYLFLLSHSFASVLNCWHPGVHRAGQGPRCRRLRRGVHHPTRDLPGHLSSLISWYISSPISKSQPKCSSIKPNHTPTLSPKISASPSLYSSHLCLLDICYFLFFVNLSFPFFCLCYQQPLWTSSQSSEMR